METVALAGDPMAVTVYSHRFATEAIRSCTLGKLMAVGLNPREQCNFVQWFEELTKGPGDTIKWPLIQQINSSGIRGLAQVTGQEIPLTWLTDQLYIDRLREAMIFDNLSQQRVPFSLRNSIKVTLANWQKQMLEYGLANQLGGNTNQTNTNYTGLNTPIAPDTAHWIFGGNAANEAGLISNAFKMTIDKILQLVALAQTGLANPIKPVVINGIEVAGILFLNGYQVRDLRSNFTDGQWGDIFRASLQGGQVQGNPIFTQAIGMYDNVVIHQNDYLPWGNDTQNTVVDSTSGLTVPAPNSLGAAGAGTTSVGRAVFVGAQAAMFANGAESGPGDQPMRAHWVEELIDANAKLRVTVGMTWGIKKTRFNPVGGSGTDFATIVLSTYASPDGN